MRREEGSGEGNGQRETLRRHLTVLDVTGRHASYARKGIVSGQERHTEKHSQGHQNDAKVKKIKMEKRTESV